MKLAIEQLIKDIEQDIKYTANSTGRARFSDEVMRALRNVVREKFIPPAERANAYQNRPLPIGHSQTISQPYIVALMTDFLDTRPDHKVMEIGTGSGYQAAVLSNLVKEVYSVEVIPELAKKASETLASLGYHNVHVCVGDGYNGWSDFAPYDGIIVTAAAPKIPTPLISQLKPTGRMVIPVGEQWGAQELMLVIKGADDSVQTQKILEVSFVPFVRN
jgi:protein-L-isoaspartate(D-aspartate) O-methyltransferase